MSRTSLPGRQCPRLAQSSCSPCDPSRSTVSINLHGKDLLGALPPPPAAPRPLPLGPAVPRLGHRRPQRHEAAFGLKEQRYQRQVGGGQGLTHGAALGVYCIADLSDDPSQQRQEAAG